MKKTIFIILFLLIAVNFGLAKNIIDVRITKVEPRDEYKIKFLKLLLEKAKVKYKISTIKFRITKPREFIEVKKGKLINVGLFTSTKKFESNLIPIRYPLYKGLVGYKIFLINKKKQKIFEKIKSLNQLKKLICVQGLWADADVLEAAGFKVVRVKYDNIFRMLNYNRDVDFFPRGIYEVFFEMDIKGPSYPNITLEKHIMLHYPFAMYLYVSPKNPKLANALKKGLKIGLTDGSIKKLQDGCVIGDYTIKKIISLTKPFKRIIYEIPNPFLTKQTRKVLKKMSIKLDKK